MISSFIENGYKVQKFMDQVFLVENFITQEEQNFLMNLAEKSTQEDWEKEYTKNLKNFCIEKFGRDDVENLVKEGKFEITENWSDKIIAIHQTTASKNITSRLKDVLKTYENLDIRGFGSVQRQTEGVPLKAHTDIHTDPSIQYASIIYLNDDYNGGEFYFVNKDFEIKPPARSLLIFPGTDEFEHGVNSPQAGPIRYVLPGFIHTKGFYENNKF